MRQIEAVQVLRAVAALAIALLHTLGDADAISAATGGRGGLVASQPLPLQAGVDLFFVISGFIMVYSSQHLFGEPGAAKAFISRRIARIVPLYWATTTLLLAVAVLAPRFLNSETPTAGQILAAYAFYPVARSDGLILPIFSLGWSLNYEMYFYAVFALALVSGKRAAIPMVAAYFAATVVIGATLSAKPVAIQFWTDPIVLEFAAGALLAHVYAKGARLSPVFSVCLMAAAVVLLHTDLTQSPYGLARGFAWGIPAVVLFCAATFCDWPVRSGLLSAFLIKLGDASYALYLAHPFVMRGVKQFWLKAGLGMIGPLAYVAVALPLAVCVALVVYVYFERPAERRLRFLLAARAHA